MSLISNIYTFWHKRNLLIEVFFITILNFVDILFPSSRSSICNFYNRLRPAIPLTLEVEDAQSLLMHLIRPVPSIRY